MATLDAPQLSYDSRQGLSAASEASKSPETHAPKRKRPSSDLIKLSICSNEEDECSCCGAIRRYKHGPYHLQLRNGPLSAEYGNAVRWTGINSMGQEVDIFGHEIVSEVHEEYVCLNVYMPACRTRYPCATCEATRKLRGDEATTLE
jgi:hypothetical protein